jgi:septal ring factor EnvC (AmiA/AmiB activator)
MDAALSLTLPPPIKEYPFNTINMRKVVNMRSVLLLLNVILLSSAFAEDILSLQQKTNFAYEQMKQAEREAEAAEYQAKTKQEQLMYFKQRIVETEQELKSAEEELKAANAKKEATIKRWQELSDTLSQEWGKQESQR